MKMPEFPQERWLGNLLLDEDRECFKLMTPEQKRLVRFAYKYGRFEKEKEK